MKLCKNITVILVLAIVPLSSILASVRFAAGGLSMGLSVGFSPDVFYLSDRSEQIATQNLNILNKMDKINKLYNSTAYGEKQVIRDFKFDGAAMDAIPVEISFKYSWFGVMMRLGMVYYNIPTDTKSYVLTTGASTTRNYTSGSGSDTLYKDITNLYDSNPTNDENLARGLRPTYGQPVRFYQFIYLKRFDMPITFGISMFDLGPASFYFGGGMTLHWASKTRVVHAEAEKGVLTNPDNYKDDIDKFSTTSLGFNIMMGAEYRIAKDVGIIMDMTLNFGKSSPITDSIRTGAYTNNSLFHGNQGYDYGGNEKPEAIAQETGSGSADAIQFGKGLERTDSLDFTGLRLMIGMNYHLSRNVKDD